MAGLRNVLVHQYLDVDTGKLVAMLENLDDAAAIAVAIVRWLRDAGELTGG